eukprot:s2627_g5.t1
MPYVGCNDGLLPKAPPLLVLADVASAFYGVVTQLVANSGAQPSDDLVDKLTARLQLEPGDVEALRGHLAEPTALQTAGADPWTDALADRMSCGNWFAVKNDTVPVATYRGTRPGSSFADVLFAILAPRVLRCRDALRAGFDVQSSCPSLPWDGHVCLAGCSAECVGG